MSTNANIQDMVLDLIQEEVFPIQVEEMAKNVIIFGADLSSSVHANNKVSNALVLGKSFIQRINGTTIMQKKCVRLISLLAIKNFV